jgi:hypothetical protein
LLGIDSSSLTIGLSELFLINLESILQVVRSLSLSLYFVVRVYKNLQVTKDLEEWISDLEIHLFQPSKALLFSVFIFSHLSIDFSFISIKICNPIFPFYVQKFLFNYFCSLL